MNQQGMELNPPWSRVHTKLTYSCSAGRNPFWGRLLQRTVFAAFEAQNRRNLMWGLARRVYGPLSLTIMRDVVEKVASSRSIMPRE